LIFFRLALLLLRPNATVTSYLHAAKRLRIGDDKIRRAVLRLEEHFGRRLVNTGGRRLTLTALGTSVADAAGQFDALLNGVADDGPESLVLDADPLLAVTVLALAFPDFFSVFADTVALVVTGFDPIATPERLDNGAANLGLGWALGDGHASAVPLGVSVPWVVILPPDHPFSKREVPLGGIGSFDRVFFPADERSLAATATALQPLPAGRRVGCPSVAAVLAAVESGSGVGLVPWVPWQPAPALRTIPVAEIEPDRPAVFLPRRGADLTEAAGSLRTILLRVAAEPYLPAVPAGTTPDAADLTEPTALTPA
jgi:DNA-binding transcriptional LysR family regulator